MRATRRVAPRVAVLVAAVACSWALAGGGSVATAAPVSPLAPADPTSTTIEPATTTTTVPATTTTVPATTTTVPATTTTTRPERPTTSVPTTTTTTSVPTATTSSSTPWGLIVLIVVLVIAIVVVALLLRSRKKRAIESGWRHAVIPAVSDARLARESLLSGNAESEDPQVRASVEVQVERAATALDRAVPGAPDEQAGTMASTAAAALRNLAFAIEADRLLRHGTASPSGAQLAQADEARRARGSELDTALARLSTRVSSRSGGSSAR
jgi:hypothetical protein